MTTENQNTTKEKQVPAYYLFDTVEAGGKKESKYVGAVFPHKKGPGFTILIGGKRYAAFPPKVKTEATEGASAQPEATGEKGA